jgi:hypothetical protein
MLHDFLTLHHDELIRRCSEKSAKRFEPTEIPPAMDHGVPLFVQQLVDTLLSEQAAAAEGIDATDAASGRSERDRAAVLHGVEMLRFGYSIDQVVREYVDVCQSVTDMAVELDAYISIGEFRTLNRCLDDAIADAVSSFESAREAAINGQACTTA